MIDPDTLNKIAEWMPFMLSTEQSGGDRPRINWSRLVELLAILGVMTMVLRTEVDDLKTQVQDLKGMVLQMQHDLYVPKVDAR